VRRPSAADVERMQHGFRGVRSVEDGVGRSSHVLTELTHNVGIAAAIPASAQVLDRVELIPLADRRVLVVVVTGNRTVHNRLVTLDEELSADELNSIRNYLNYHFSGWVLSEAREELERRLQLQGAWYDALLKRLSLLYSRGFLDIEFDPEVHLEGAAYLVDVDLHLTRESMRELLRALEEKRRILQILDSLLESPPGAVCVHVGLGDVHPTMKQLSLIGVTVATAGGLTAKVAVLGPMRMHYEKVMSAVAHVGHTLETLPS
jgi:heat-inducible transcriptional repressor